MAEFTYNTTKNARTDHTWFKLNYRFHPQLSFNNNIDVSLRSCSANKLAKELRELIDICYQNLFYI